MAMGEREGVGRKGEGGGGVTKLKQGVVFVVHSLIRH